MNKSLMVPLISLGLIGSSCSKKSERLADTTNHLTVNDTIRNSHSTQIATADTTSHNTLPFDGKKVSVNTLPNTVKPFVAQHYPGYHIASASYDPLCGGAPAIDVSIRESGHPTYSVIFKPDGSYVQKEQDVSITNAPAIVLQKLKQQYPGFKADKQIEELTLADGTLEYSFDLSKGAVKKEIILSKDGSVMCDSKE